MEGLITKILSDKCYVKINKEVVICGLRGKFRAQKLLPLVGDKVIINKEKKIIEKKSQIKNKSLGSTDNCHWKQLFCDLRHMSFACSFCFFLMNILYTHSLFNLNCTFFSLTKFVSMNPY